MRRESIFIRYIIGVVFGLLVLAQPSYSFSPVGIQKYKENSALNPLSIKTGALYLSHYHQNFNQTFYSLDVKVKKDLSYGGHFVFDGFGLLKVEGDGASSYSLREMYYSNKYSSKLKYTVGRKIVNWSDLEDYLPAGFWNNAWDFNKAAPVKEGLFGAFVDYKLSKDSKVEFFVSPISIPKATSHYKFNDDGTVKAHTLWFTPPPETVNYEGDQYAARYFLDVDIADLVLEPQIGGNFKWANDATFVSASYLYGPSKDIDMAIDFSLNATTPDTNVDVFVLPKRVNVHKGTLEFGRKWNKNSKTTMSGSYRQRVKGLSSDINDRESHIGTSSGGIYQIAHEQFFKDKSIHTMVHVIENTAIKNVASGELDEFLLTSLLVPFRYRRGIGGSFGYKIGSRLNAGLYGYYDTELKGVMGDFKLQMNFKRVNVALGYNFVEALGAETKEFYKDFRENDSYHMGVSYVF
ncbi:MAG: hypothetical protein ACRBBP_04875 [Bdellovibrionales bacterium]